MCEGVKDAALGDRFDVDVKPDVQSAVCKCMLAKGSIMLEGAKDAALDDRLDVKADAQSDWLCTEVVVE